jgi:hypothetical protein
VAALLLRLGPDPADRVAFVRRFPEWRGDLTVLPRLLRASRDSGFTPGMCLALGGIDPAGRTPDERRDLTAAPAALHRDAGDGATHSAAGFALRKWGVPTPAPAPGAGRGWFVDRRGMTRIEAPIGRRLAAARDGRRTFLADREVSVDLFRAFAADPAGARRRGPGPRGSSPGSPSGPAGGPPATTARPRA